MTPSIIFDRRCFLYLSGVKPKVKDIMWISKNHERIFHTQVETVEKMKQQHELQSFREMGPAFAPFTCLGPECDWLKLKFTDDGDYV